MKILSAQQIKQLDNHTITHEPIASIDLMERASMAFVHWFIAEFREREIPIYIFCGTGNNGGDGLAIARMLHREFYTVHLILCTVTNTIAPDFQENLKKLPSFNAIPRLTLKENDEFPHLPINAIVIDALLGSGLNRPIEGYLANLIHYINSLPNSVISVDIPSGLFADQPTTSEAIKANYTFSFEMPKLAFFFPENSHYVGEWTIESIGLDQKFIENTSTPYHYLDNHFARSLLRRRNKYDHKGTFGHSLLIGGSYGKVGAVILATHASLRSGTGLTTVHIPKMAYQIVQTAIPEAMVNIDMHEFVFSKHPDLQLFKSIGIGCGLGTNSITVQALNAFLDDVKVPIVIDADALNIIAQHKNLLKKIPKNSILTPHIKEFERIFGKSDNDFKRNELQRQIAQDLDVYIVLKGAHTAIATPQGECYFNATGNPGMATAGSGDVLTGILTGLLAQPYTSFEACLLGVFLHGLSGDLAAEMQGQEALIAGDIIAHLGKAFKYLQ